MSIRKIFEEELADLKTQLVEMCRLTEQMISDAITALVNRDRELGKSIGVMDKHVDEYEMAIEKKCMRILLKQQPVAKDFREVSTALKMITDIERFGDQAADIGDLVYTMPGDAYIKKLTHITAMGNLAVRMVRECVSSFINNDEALADEVIALDDRMDEIIYIIEDDEGIRELYEGAFEGVFATKMFENGKDFFFEFKKTRPSLIILDIKRSFCHF